MAIDDFLFTWGIAARPFLPAGQGGLILIAGGLSMTAFAMLALMARHRPIDASTGHRVRPPGGARAARTAEPRPNQARPRPVQHAATVQTVKPTPQPVAPPRPKVDVARAIAHEGNDRLVWPEYVRGAAARTGLHSTHILAVDRTRCVIEVKRCKSCRRGRRGCDKERRRLLHAARKLSRRARVHELSCNVGGHHVCTFQVDMGAKR